MSVDFVFNNCSYPMYMPIFENGLVVKQIKPFIWFCDKHLVSVKCNNVNIFMIDTRTGRLAALFLCLQKLLKRRWH